MDRLKRISAACVLAATCLLLIGTASHARQPQSDPHAFQLSGDFGGTHDPSIAKDGDVYYVFATGAVHPAGPDSAHTPAPGDPTPPVDTAALGQFPIRCSKDLQVWTLCGQVFSEIPSWIRTSSPKTRELWAPDISFFDGLYHLYYAFSIFGKNTSGIGLAVNETLDSKSPNYKWVERGLVLSSTEQDDFNAIDPNLIIDAQGNAWLSFGSFWGGIKMRRLDRATGKLSTTDTRTYSLATRARPADTAPSRPGLPPDWEAVEAPFILRHANYYYLFVSWDLCCRGTKSTYKTMVGRSAKITGPYLDQQGKPMMSGGGTPFLVANKRWLGPGGESLLHQPDRDLIVFHAYDAHTGRPALQISTIDWHNGWPAAALQDDTK
jgi:arabinan endo-1,5-alpha-L-arabinosidase